MGRVPSFGTNTIYAARSLFTFFDVVGRILVCTAGACSLEAACVFCVDMAVAMALVAPDPWYPIAVGVTGVQEEQPLVLLLH